MKCQIRARKLYSWEIDTCNDCNEIGRMEVKYPKFNPIQVCINCYKKYYKEKVSGYTGYRNVKRIH